ncbi:MAG: dienelactone hydrolase family protein [Proteobacteria bacterium]|nr:dienelactone hydrolase family protein [Pseudomonadota bacterium]
MSERAGREIAFDSGGDSVAAYLATPASGHGPGVLVIQEWWGLVDHIRDVCDRLARAGFTALAPDLYRGTSTSDPEEAGRLMMNLEIPRASRDLEAAVAELQNQSEVDGSRVGIIGFCMGGQLALSAATQNAKIGAVIDCYGIHPNVTLDLSGLDAAVFGVFAENDDFIPAEAVEKLRADLEGAGVRATIKTYLGVHHAFLNDTRPDVYDAETAEEVWNEVNAFLKAELA